VQLAQHRAALDGIQHRFAAEPARPRPGELILLHATTSGPLSFDAVRAFYTLDGASVHPGTASSGAELPFVEFHKTRVTWDNVDWRYIQHWEGMLPAQADDTLVRYQVAARLAGFDEGGKGRWIYADNQATDTAQATDFALWVSDLPEPAWVKDALIYHIFVDRFYPGADKAWRRPKNLAGFYGGTIRGIAEKLDYIEELGFNTLWLSPFFASPSHHGYDATDMYTVEPRLGTNADLYQLIDAAHARGFRLILDFVANHWSNLHPTFLSAQEDRNSPYYDWYLWNQWPEEYECFFDAKMMPKLNLAIGSPARQYLLDCARFWLEKGFDGYRLDYAYGPPLDFWVDFRRTCKRTKPEAWLFGEVIHSAPAQKLFAGLFDGMIDFLLAEALRQAFGYEHWNLAQFDAYLAGHEAYFQGLFDRLTILDNHDMNRFLYLADDDPRRLKLGALVLYTLAGNPINYYGTEAGVTQERPTHYDNRGFFEEARQPMKWDAAANADLLDYFRRLVSLRKAYPALRLGTRRTIYLDTEAGIYAYVRELAGEKLLVVMNQREQQQSLSLLQPGLAGAYDLLNGQLVESDRKGLRITLAPKSGALIGTTT
jgi:glycosidase